MNLYLKGIERKLKEKVIQLDEKIKESEETRIATLNILEDVDETRRKLDKAYKELKKLDKMKAEFMSMAAHELKTPLIPIIGYLDMIIRGEMGKINPKEKESLVIALRSAQRLQRLVGDILAISKLETGTMKFYIDDISLTVLISNLVESMMPLANEKKIKLTSKIDKNLPLIKGDISRITEVFENIINNAIKFTEKGEVLIESKIEDKNIIISVRDSGIGMSREFIKKKLFKKFQQEDSTERRKYGGTGLGLAICKDIVERYKGKIWVESEIGKGSTFYVSLPIKK
jgi:signal transduction histidine kinase